MEAIYNFRDFGGCPAQDGRRVKQGVLFRSGSLAQATPADLEALAALGIRTVCDLRTPGERRRGADRLPGGAVQYVHLPVVIRRYSQGVVGNLLHALASGQGRRLDYTRTAVEAYREYATAKRQQLAALLRLAIQPGSLPLLIHCMAGKDRTGFACALIQGLLGVPQEQVMAEYLLSNRHLQDFTAGMLARFAFLRRVGIAPEQFLPLFEVRPAYLLAALEAIRQEYGTLDDYARDGLHFSDGERERLQALLLEAG